MIVKSLIKLLLISFYGILAAATLAPSKQPTNKPTSRPTTKKPSKYPTVTPTNEPSAPTFSPTGPELFPNAYGSTPLSATTCTDLGGCGVALQHPDFKCIGDSYILTPDGYTIDTSPVNDKYVFVAKQLQDANGHNCTLGLDVATSQEYGHGFLTLNINTALTGILSGNCQFAGLQWLTTCWNQNTNALNNPEYYFFDSSSNDTDLPIWESANDLTNTDQELFFYIKTHLYPTYIDETGRHNSFPRGENSQGLFMNGPCPNPLVPYVQVCTAKSSYPTSIPTGDPTMSPTQSPTSPRPTRRPSQHPTMKPTRKPTNKPTRKPTRKPTKKPTRRPTRRPTRKPICGHIHKDASYGGWPEWPRSGLDCENEE